MSKKYLFALALFGSLLLTVGLLNTPVHTTGPEPQIQELATTGGGFLTIDNIERLG